MYEWLLESSKTGLGNISYQYTKKNGDPLDLEKVFLIEEKASHQISFLLKAIEQELNELFESRSYLDSEDQILVEEANNWMKEDGRIFGKELHGMIPLITNEKAASVFDQSIERLIFHFNKRKDLFHIGEINFELYLEWLLELPYFVKERLQSASALVPRLENPIIIYEVRKKPTTSTVYRGNIEPQKTRASSQELALCC